MSKEIDVLMNNAIDEMTKEQQLEYYKEYYKLSRQQVADETHLESSRLRDEIISELEKKYQKAYFREEKGLFDYEGIVVKVTLIVVQLNCHYAIMIYDKRNKEIKMENNATISAKTFELLGKYFELEGE